MTTKENSMTGTKIGHAERAAIIKEIKSFWSINTCIVNEDISEEGLLFLEKIKENPSCDTAEMFYNDFYSQKQKSDDFKKYSKKYLQWVCERIKDHIETSTYPSGFVHPADYELFIDIFNVESEIVFIV